MLSNEARSDHNKISPTAKITAYWRSLSDIPFSKEIAEAVAAESTARELLGDRIVQMGTLSPTIFEVRYKSINHALARVGIDNVLELANGLSPRGLEIVSKGGVYVGTDLPDMHEESSSIMLSIAERGGLPLSSLHYQSANVLNRDELKTAAAWFKGKKYAVCNEGLLMYLDHEEKKITASNIRELLLESGGCWITTDIVFRVIRESIASILGEQAKKVIQPAMKAIAEQVGRDVRANDFTNKEEALAFFEGLGFAVQEIPMYDHGYELSTKGRLHEAFREKFLGILSSATVWVLTPR